MSSKHLIVAAASLTMFTAIADANEPTVQEVLQSYVDDYRHDPTVRDPITFGIRISGEGGGDWHVVVRGKKKGNVSADVTLEAGLAPSPTFFFTTDVGTLRKINAGKMNALTAMAAEFSWGRSAAAYTKLYLSLPED